MNIAKQPHRDVVGYRQERVAYWRVRGLTVRQIVDKLTEDGSVNPSSGAPWVHATIENDCNKLLAMWQASRDRSNDEHVVEQMARYEALFTKAMEADDVSNAVKILKAQADLLGLSAPKKIDIELLIRQDAEANGLDPDELIRRARVIDIEQRRALTG